MPDHPKKREATHSGRRSRSRRSPSRQPADASSRDTILDVASTLMAERGFAATSIGAICDATRLAPTTIYWHFGSKDGLLAAVVERSVDRWYAELEAAMADGPGKDQPPSFDRFVEVMADSYRTSPQALRLMLWLGLDRSHPNPEVREAVQQARRRAVTLIAGHAEVFIPIGQSGVAADLYERLARLMLVHLDGIFIAHEIDDDADRLDELFAIARTSLIAAGTELLRDAARRGEALSHTASAQARPPAPTRAGKETRRNR